MSEKTTWRKLITRTMRAHQDAPENIVSSTLKDDDWDRVFYDGFGCSEGLPFTVWTHTRVYFPAVYDGSEWCASVSRNPDEKPTPHVGGEQL